jgi:hypothetical protein
VAAETGNRPNNITTIKTCTTSSTRVSTCHLPMIIRKLRKLQPCLWIIAFAICYGERIDFVPFIHGFRPVVPIRRMYTDTFRFRFRFSAISSKQSYRLRRQQTPLCDTSVSSSEALPNNALMVDSVSTEQDDESSDDVATLRSVTFSRLPKDQGNYCLHRYCCCCCC